MEIFVNKYWSAAECHNCLVVYAFGIPLRIVPDKRLRYVGAEATFIAAPTDGPSPCTQPAVITTLIRAGMRRTPSQHQEAGH